MEANETHETIAGQIHHMKPDEYTPGVDVGISIVDDCTVKVVVFPDETETMIRYDRGRDLYAVTQRTLGQTEGGETVEGIYCDQLGGIVFGEKAKAWTMPMVQILGDDGEWKVIA